MLDDDDEDGTEFGVMLVRHRQGEGSFIGQSIIHRHTLYDALEHFITAGQTTEILGYYPCTTPSRRRDIYYDTIEAEGREYP